MKRRRTLIVVAVGVMAVVGLLAAQKPKADGKLLLLDWAAKSSLDTPPTAIVLVMGVKDTEPTSWSGKATVSGAKVAHREGYRFRDGDKLTEPDGWEASSRRPIRVPPRQPAVARTEGIDRVGIVLHLADVKDDAELSVEMKNADQGKVKLPLKDVLSGKRVTILDGNAAVRLISTATPVATEKTEDDFPAACYGPDGTLWVAYVAYHVRDDDRRSEQHPFKEQPKDFKALYTPDFGDQVMVKYNRGGKWSEPIPITDAKQDIVRCAIAADGKGAVVVAYSARREGRHHLYARPVSPKLGKEWQITRDEAASYLSPVMCTSPWGDILLAAQLWSRDGGAVSYYATGLAFQDTGWTAQASGSGGANNHWHVAIASGPDEWRIACDRFIPSWDYDVALPVRGGRGSVKGGGDEDPVASSSRFEARPSICYDPQGRLWIAYEEGPERWGKDYGAFVTDQGDPLYSSRSVRVVCLQDGKLLKPVAELPTSEARKPHPIAGGKPVPNFERTARYSNPGLGIDGKGRLWLTYRQKFGTRYSSIPGSYWLTFARRFDGDHWTEPIEVHHSDGLLDSRPVLLPHKSGGLLVVHNTDGRFTTPETINNDVYLSYVNLPGEPVEPKLVPHDPGKKDPKLVAMAEAEGKAVKRIRDYRIEVGGKKYQPLRGEFHRHTELSWDGGPDGSLEDMFRYAIDAAAMDWIGNGDHDNGAGREYSWWLVQKLTDAYHVKDHFTPMFSYERSVAYPHGHRNCVFARRGVRTLPRLAEMDQEKRVAGVSADDTKMLYRYLKELDGVCASHTSATGMGTDWRDNDPAVEPVVEIYQGDRMNYEYEGAPRSGYDPQGATKPAQIGGWQPKGFLDHALKEKGYRLGFQSSSDHWSTHISFCVVLAEKHDRAGILDALKKRHVYGATDDIVLDVRSGTHLMGDEFKADAAPALEMNVLGTGPIARIDVLRDSEVVETIKPGKAEYKGKWADPRPAAGTHYYYVRVQQEDGQLAWASPMWIESAK